MIRQFQPDPRICIVALLIAASFAARPAWPHGGEDHSGESLATTAGPTIGEPIFVTKEAQFSLNIRTARSMEATRPDQLKTLGTVVTPTLRKAQVHAPFSGRVLSGDEIPSQGTFVKKGQVIARIEQTTDISNTVSLNAEIARTESELQQAREERTLAGQEFERVSKLGDAASGRRKQESSPAVAISRQRVAGLERTLEKLHAGATDSDSLRILDLTSPIDGVIDTADIAPGEYIEPAKMLFELIDSSVVWVEADIYELDLAAVQGAVRAVALSDAYPQERFEGFPVYIGSTVSRDTRTVKAVFSVDNTEGLLRAGMAMDVFIDSKQVRTGLMVPKAAIVNESGRTLVYQKIAPETFAARPVVTRGQWDSDVMVEEGLQDGDIVAVSGLYQIRMSTGQAPVPGPVSETALAETAPVSEENTDKSNHKDN